MRVCWLVVGLDVDKQITWTSVWLAISVGYIKVRGLLGPSSMIYDNLQIINQSEVLFEQNVLSTSSQSFDKRSKLLITIEMSSKNQLRLSILSIAVVMMAFCAFQKKADAIEVPKLVESGSSKRYSGGNHVGVNLPMIFNMDLDTRPNHSGVRMDLNVLKGLVHVFLDRQRNSSGKNSGPIQVDIEGMSVFNNQ